MTVIFSLDLDSKRFLTKMSISDNNAGGVSFEGNLGQINDASLIEDTALEIKGQHGNLIIEIGKEILQKILDSSMRKSSIKESEKK